MFRHVNNTALKHLDRKALYFYLCMNLQRGKQDLQMFLKQKKWCAAYNSSAGKRGQNRFPAREILDCKIIEAREGYVYILTFQIYFLEMFFMCLPTYTCLLPAMILMIAFGQITVRH